MAYIPRSERYNPAFKPSARHTVTPSKVYIQDFFEGRIVKQEHNTNRYQLQLNKKANRCSLEKSLKLSVGLDLAHIGDPTELIDGVDLYSLITKIENPTLTFAPIDGIQHCLITQSDGSWKLYEGQAVIELLDILNEED